MSFLSIIIHIIAFQADFKQTKESSDHSRFIFILCIFEEKIKFILIFHNNNIDIKLQCNNR
jgi:hypothetical protein